jgi:short-subunit dehydrogenase
MAADLKSKYPGAALITGASSGIGEAFARRLAKDGVHLVLVARRRALLDKLADELHGAHGVKVHAIDLDLAQPDSAAKLKAAVDEQGIKIGMLINNAGFGSHGHFHKLDPANEARMVDLNCRAPVALTAAFLPAMVKRKKGAIIFLASVAAYQPTPYFATYGATKSFNLMYAEALWAELKPLGIDVIALSPGYTRTEFQSTAGVKLRPPGGWQEAHEVVDVCLAKLGHAPSVVSGMTNYLSTLAVGLLPRAQAAKIAGSIAKPK